MGIFSEFTNRIFPPRCIFCNRILRPGARLVCENCLEHLSSSEVPLEGNWFSRCYAPLINEGAVHNAIGRFKFQNQSGYATEFGRILARCIQENYKGQYALITWVPVSEERRKKRGYDQSMLLAMAAALELGDVAVETLKKSADNAVQSLLGDVAARRSNVKDVYCVPEPELVEGKRILLIDDIATTGATLDEAARTLLEAGATEVMAAVLAGPPKS